MKLWSGRFGKDTDALVNELNASISFDQRLYKEDITGSMAHAAMLADRGIISREDTDAIIQGLRGILADAEAGKIAFTADNEDIHMNVEALLTARIGEAGKRLHTARSRNDQVALDFRMYVREQIPVITGEILGLMEVLCRQAGKYQTAVMPGYTHLQRAQPISSAQHLGLRRYVPTGRHPAGGLCGATERVPSGKRRSGRDHLSHRPPSDREGAGL